MSDMDFIEARFFRRWQKVLATNGGRVALWDGEGKALATFSEIAEKALAWELRIGPLAPQTPVGVQLGNHPEWPAVLLALWKLGAIVVPLDVSLREEATRQILREAGAGMRIGVSQEVVKLDFIRKTAFQKATRLCKATSGTGGRPRLIEFGWAELLADADAICETMGLRSEDVNYGAIPFSHSYGFANLLLPLLTRGIALVVARDPFPQALIDGMRKTRATILPGIPVFYQSFNRLGLVVPETVRLCVSAGAPLAGEIARDFFELNARKIHSFYGASECGGITYDASEEVEVPPGYVGVPLRGVQVEYLPTFSKIAVRGPAVGLGIYGEPQDAALQKGVFRPDDWMEVIEGGWRITGRDSLFINVAGKKLDPQTVVNVIRPIAGVGEVMVFGVPDGRRGELTVALVQTKRAASREIIAHCRSWLAPWQVPVEVVCLERLPQPTESRTHRRELIDWYLERQSVLQQADAPLHPLRQNQTCR